MGTRNKEWGIFFEGKLAFVAELYFDSYEEAADFLEDKGIDVNVPGSPFSIWVID